MDHALLIEKLIPIVRAAGDEILEVYCTAFEVRSKADATPVTRADERSHDVLVRGIEGLTPGTPIISEESAEHCCPSTWGRAAWLVDPLDGTKEFVGRTDEFTINVALVEDGLPTLGVVFAPALRRLFAGVVGVGAFVEDEEGRRPIAVAGAHEAGLSIVSSRSHREESEEARVLSRCTVARHARVGSALKFCLVACGEAHLYPRCGPTMEWDTAAGHAIVLASGGHLTCLDGSALSYGKSGFANPGFIAFAPCAARAALAVSPEEA